MSVAMADAVTDINTELEDDDYDPLDAFSDLPKFKFNQLTKSFVRDCYGANARKVKELQPILKTGNTYEIFEALWNMEGAQEFLDQNVLLPEQALKKKDEKKALIYLVRGEQQRQKDKDFALKYYNASIIFAPHPPVIIDGKTFHAPDNNSGERRRLGHAGWGAYEALGRASMARAELLLEMGHYEASIRDIEFVLHLGCPASTEARLHYMNSICHQGLLTHNERQQIYTSFSCRSAPRPACVNPNPYLTGASAAVELVHKDEKVKRGLITNRDVSQGEVLIVEKSYCNTLLPKYIRIFCMTCLRRTSTPIPCPACTQVVFCSKECRGEALLGFHWNECPVLALINALNIDVRGILACRILFKTTFQKLKGMREQISAEQNKPADIKGLTQEGALRSDDYLAVYSMIGKKAHSRTKKMERAAEAFLLLKLMIYCNRFFVKADGKPYQPSREDKLFVGSLLLHHLINLWQTADGYYEVEILGGDGMQNPMKVFAAGVFPVTNLAMTHGCYSPCAPFTHGPYLVMRATCAMPAGTMLTCKYTMFVWQAMRGKDDENFMKDFYGCNQEYNDGLNEMPIETFSLKCVRCSGKVHARCLNCDTEYNMVAAIPGMPGKFTYDYKKVISKVSVLLDNYSRTRSQILETGVTPSTDMESICTLIRFFDEYVHLPSELHRDAQMMYITVMNHRTTSVTHDNISAPGCTLA